MLCGRRVRAGHMTEVEIAEKGSVDLGTLV